MNNGAKPQLLITCCTIKTIIDDKNKVFTNKLNEVISNLKADYQQHHNMFADAINGDNSKIELSAQYKFTLKYVNQSIDKAIEAILNALKQKTESINRWHINHHNNNINCNLPNNNIENINIHHDNNNNNNNKSDRNDSKQMKKYKIEKKGQNDIIIIDDSDDDDDISQSQQINKKHKKNKNKTSEKQVIHQNNDTNHNKNTRETVNISKHNNTQSSLKDIQQINDNDGDADINILNDTDNQTQKKSTHHPRKSTIHHTSVKSQKNRNRKKLTSNSIICVDNKDNHNTMQQSSIISNSNKTLENRMSNNTNNAKQHKRSAPKRRNVRKRSIGNILSTKKDSPNNAPNRKRQKRSSINSNSAINDSHRTPNDLPYIVPPLKLNADKKALHHTYKIKEEMNKAIKIKDMAKRRGYFEKMIDNNPNLKGMATFLIAASYQQEKKWKNAIKHYQLVLDEQLLYKSALLIDRLIGCLFLNGLNYNNVDYNTRDLMTLGWKYVALDEYETVRQQWVNNDELERELMSSCSLAFDLGRYYEAKFFQNNDQSLIWYRRSMNILEQCEIIKLEKVSLDKKLYPKLNRKKNLKKIIYRKRLNILKLKQMGSKYFRSVTENVLKFYIVNIVKKLKSNVSVLSSVKLDDLEIGENINNASIEEQKCFGGFYQENKDIFMNFDEYLRSEMEQTFEMFYYYINECDMKDLCYDKPIYAEMFNNYGVYMKDVLNDNVNAMEWYQCALKYGEKNWTIHANLGEIYGETKKYNKAMQHYKKAIKFCNSQSDKKYIDKEMQQIIDMQTR